MRKNLEKGGTHFEKGEQAHHIVQSTDPRAKVARDLLDKYHIDINSADNGLKLTRQVHQTSGLQQTKTIDAVTKNLKDAADSAKDWGAARAKVLDALSKIKTGIANGKRLCP